MATFAQCQREYDNRTPEEPDDECPDCGGKVIPDLYGFRCTFCTWHVEPDFQEEGDFYEQ